MSERRVKVQIPPNNETVDGVDVAVAEARADILLTMLRTYKSSKSSGSQETNLQTAQAGDKLNASFLLYTDSQRHRVVGCGPLPL